MHIVNAMFSKGLGGIEQALVDYCEALKIEGHKVTAIIAPKAKIKESLKPLGVNIIEVKNFAAWDVFAKIYINKILKQLSPDIIITHGNRAISLIKPVAKNIPLVGVTHNYSIKRLVSLDAILATTNDLKSKVVDAGFSLEKIFKIPNMVRVGNGEGQRSPLSNPQHQSPIKIGTMGRFVPKKGFDVFIRSIAELRKSGIEFRAVIGGTGDEENNLKKLASELELDSCLEFIGWVEDKEKFFADLDVFVLPSLHEPFGIILLEAFAYKKPVVVTDSEGPSEIAKNESDALIVPKGDHIAMSAAIMRLCKDKELTKIIAENGFAKAITYDIKNFATSLNDALIRVEQSCQK